MKKLVIIGLFFGLISHQTFGQDEPLADRSLVAQELKALASIARETARDMEEKYRGFKEQIEKITGETDTHKHLKQLIFITEPTAQALVQELSKVGYQAGELLENLSSFAINETEIQKIKEIAQALKTASRQFDEFRTLVQAKVFPAIEQGLEQLKSQGPMPTPSAEAEPTEPTPFPDTPAMEPTLSEPTPSEPSPTPSEPTPEPTPSTEQPSTELPTPPVEQPTEPTPIPSEPSPVTEPSIEPTPEPTSEPMPAPTEMPASPEPQEQQKPAETIDDDIDNLPGGAPEVAHVLKRGKIEGAAEGEMKKLLEQKDKDFDEKFPGPEFLAFLGDLNILHAYAKATHDYVALANQAQEKQEEETVDRLQEKIDDIKQKYVNKINEINDRYRTTEWYRFYTK